MYCDDIADYQLGQINFLQSNQLQFVNILINGMSLIGLKSQIVFISNKLLSLKANFKSHKYFSRLHSITSLLTDLQLFFETRYLCISVIYLTIIYITILEFFKEIMRIKH